LTNAGNKSQPDRRNRTAQVRVSSAFSGGKEDLEKGKAGKNFVFVKNGHF